MDCKAFITDVDVFEIAPAEREFITREQPWGLILFQRNIDAPEQVRALLASFRDLVGRPDAPVLIDQEGGRVQRLRPPHWQNYPSGGQLASLYEEDAEAGERAAWLLGRLHAFDLLAVDITVNCLPVLDVPTPDSHHVIGDRAYGATPRQVALLGRAVAEGLMAGGVMPVMKHVPGHGRALADSHLELPTVTAPRAELEAVDFEPFRILKDLPMAMTAHVIYEAIDADLPATTSQTIAGEIIRKQIGFNGLLMSDDLHMSALSGSFEDRTAAFFAAGGDMALHCNGDLDERKAVASATPKLAGDALRRAVDAMQSAGKTDDSNEAQCRAEFETLLASRAAA